MIRISERYSVRLHESERHEGENIAIIAAGAISESTENSQATKRQPGGENKYQIWRTVEKEAKTDQGKLMIEVYKL